MSDNINITARALVAPAAGVLPASLVRELWDIGGRHIAGPIPATAAEVRAMPAEEASAAAGWMTDQAECAKLFRSDTRVSVRSGLAGNPDIDADTAAGLITWLRSRNEKPGIDLARIAGPERVAMALGTEACQLTRPSEWVEFFGVDRLRSLPECGWARNLLATALLDETSADDGWVDEVWDAAGDALRRNIVDRLFDRGSTITAQWVRRLARTQGLDQVLVRSTRVSYGALEFEDPAGIAHLVLSVSNPSHVVRFLQQLDSRSEQFTGEHLTSAADAAVEVYRRTGALPDCDEACWLIRHVSADTLPGLGQLLLPPIREFPKARYARQVATTFLNRSELDPGLAGELVTSTADTQVFTQWLRGVAGQVPTQACIAIAISAFPDGSEKRGYVARAAINAVEDIDNPDLIRVLVDTDDALCDLLERHESAPELLAQLTAHATGQPLPATDNPFAAALATRLATTATCNLARSVYSAMLNRTTLDESVRLPIARAAGAVPAFARGAFHLNPPTDASLADADLSDPDLREIASAVSVSVSIRARIILATPSQSPTSLVDSILSAGTVPWRDLEQLLPTYPVVFGRHLAGAYSGNKVRESHMRIADALTGSVRLEALDAFATAWASHGASQRLAEHPHREWATNWVASTQRVFSVLNRPVSALVLEIARRHLGDDPVAWRLFCELSTGTDFTVSEVLDLVECSR